MPIASYKHKLPVPGVHPLSMGDLRLTVGDQHVIVANEISTQARQLAADREPVTPDAWVNRADR